VGATAAGDPQAKTSKDKSDVAKSHQCTLGDTGAEACISLGSKLVITLSDPSGHRLPIIGEFEETPEKKVPLLKPAGEVTIETVRGPHCVSLSLESLPFAIIEHAK
jgi:hypothetical protein